MNLREAIKAVDPCVVQVSGESLQPVVGTGFFVHEGGYVVTALHVIQQIARMANEANRPVQVNVGIAHTNSENMRANFTVTDCEVVDADEVYDLALVRLGRNPLAGELGTGIVVGEVAIPLPAQVAAIDPDRPEDGEPIAVSGYPLSNPVLITNAGHLASVWHSESRRDFQPGVSPLVDWYFGDVEVNPGNSGGPVYRVETAEVIGVCRASQPAPVRRGDNGEPARMSDVALNYSSGITVFTPAKYIAEMLARHSLWESADGEAQEQ